MNTISVYYSKNVMTNLCNIKKTLPFIHILFRFISMSMQITWQIQKNILKDENSVYGFG